MDANLKRKLARVVAILAVALGAGQLMQSMSGSGSKEHVARSETAQKARNIETLAGVAETAPPPAAQPSGPQAPRLPAALPVATVDPTPVQPLAPTPAAVAEATPAPAQTPLPTLEPAKADVCAITLDLSGAANAMIALTLVAPCHPNERVVLKHAGLAVTGMTTATGSLFVDIPALEQAAVVEVLFKDGAKITQSVNIPEIANLRRFAVQWQADDLFQIHGFEDDLGYGGPGDVWAEAPHAPAPGLPAKGGFLTALGDPGTDLPLLAEVYTYPSNPNAKSTVVVEAPVTAKACGREILAETLISQGGQVTIGDLSAAMPGCDAVGDYLVLKNLVPDLNIASSN